MNYTKVFKGLLIALAGAALTFAADQIPHMDFGPYTLLVAACLSAVVNAGRQYLISKGYSL